MLHTIKISGLQGVKIHTGRREGVDEYIMGIKIREEERDGLGRCETLSQKTEMRLEQKLTRSLTRGIAFLFLRSGMLSMLYRAPPMLGKETHHISASYQITAVKNLDTTNQLHN